MRKIMGKQWGNDGEMMGKVMGKLWRNNVKKTREKQGKECGTYWGKQDKT